MSWTVSAMMFNRSTWSGVTRGLTFLLEFLEENAHDKREVLDDLKLENFGDEDEEFDLLFVCEIALEEVVLGQDADQLL